MSTPIPPYQPLPSFDEEFPFNWSAPAHKPRNRGVMIFAGMCVTALVAGAAGGAVGYVAARDTLPTTVASAIDSSSPSLPAAGSIAAVAAAVQPAVVQLNVTGADGKGTGSGFIISTDGYLITNNHVAGMASENGIDVLFADGTQVKGQLVGANAGYDLAVVKVDKTNLPTVPLGSSAGLLVGDSVIALGSPLGLQGTVTSGIVSALNRPVTATGESGDSSSSINAIQTDAAINPGNSGGPLVNGKGAVIGVNSAIASMGAAEGQQAGSIGLGFAIPIDTAKRIADEIINTGSAKTPVIGVQLDISFTGPGAKVATVTAGGAAESAGLQAGDVISKVNGTAIADGTQLIVTIRSFAPGDRVQVVLTRDGESITLPVNLTAAKS
ncbi:MAG: trypsin-like peptidase domain-containing protein [Actinomycetota bacterium]|nr:trypsin-like peptidase domain-containing protein [Actinomycetota bacterium]